MQNLDIIIIGAGPAGISSSIYAARSGRKVLVLDHGKSKLLSAKTIENYYGAGKISGRQLYEDGISHAKELGIKVLKQEVVSAEKDYEANLFTVKTTKGEYQSSALIIASGGAKPETDDRLNNFKGKNISSCAVCDGFFYKGKTVGVLGSGAYALSEAETLSPLAKTVYILADGKTKLQNNGNIKVITSQIADFIGTTKLEKVRLETGEEIKLDGLFLAKGTLSALDLAKKLGLSVKDNHIVINTNCETSLAGVYAAGDITGGLYQVTKAVYEGTIAGLKAALYVKNM